MRASLALLTASLACASAWYAPKSNQTISASSSIIPPRTGGIPHPTGEPHPHNPVHPPGSGIQPPQTPKYPTGTGGTLPLPTVPVPPVITKTIYGPGTATITQTFVGTTSIVSTVTKFVPCSTPVATAGSSTYFSTSLTTILSLTTITAETTSYVVVCPTPTPESDSSNSDSHPVLGSPNCPSCPILDPSACPPVATITQTIYLPAPSPPAGHGSASGNSIANGNGNGSGSGSGSAPGTNGGSNNPQHPPIFPPGPYHPNPPAPYPPGNGTQPVHPTGTGKAPIVSGIGNKPTATGGYKIHY
ncbi:MAG: hypothetical protein L6R38_001426 [Xanthoria sp. 2 TBL-2021]|nr:MAG: hypothetical protein L6R38_001426 [Xanthoria sp. 2 TBL-2021]